MQNQWIQPIRIRLARATFPPCPQSRFFQGFSIVFQGVQFTNRGDWGDPISQISPNWKIGPGFHRGKALLGDMLINHWIRRVFPIVFPQFLKQTTMDPPWACSCLASTITIRSEPGSDWNRKHHEIPKSWGYPNNHHAKSLECAECLEGKSENPSTFSLLERALLDEDWMHLFDSARPSSHH